MNTPWHYCPRCNLAWPAAGDRTYCPNCQGLTVTAGRPAGLAAPVIDGLSQRVTWLEEQVERLLRQEEVPV